MYQLQAIHALRATDTAAAEAVRAQIEAVGKADSLHADDAARALDFWTVEEVSGDLSHSGLCEVLICGGYYTITARAL